MNSPRDTILFMAADATRDLRVIGISKRSLAAVKLDGLLRVSGFDPLDWRIEQTLTIPAYPGAREAVQKQVYPKAAQRHRRYFDNRSGLVRQQFGALVMYVMTKGDGERLMASARHALKAYVAGDACPT